MTTVVQARHQQLRHYLTANDAETPCDAWWLITRTHEYAAVARIAVDVVLDPLSYYRRTGLRVGRWWAGAAYTGTSGARPGKPLIYLNPRLLPTRGEAELTIVHEVMHARWPSYGHRTVAFARAQQLLDAVGEGQT